MNYAYFVGILLQLINDCVDFVPSEYNPDNVANKLEDCFCDIKNKNITLPLIHLLAAEEVKGKRLTEKLLNKDIKSLIKKQELNVFKEICPFILNKTMKDCESIAVIACQQLNPTDLSDQLTGKTEIAFDNLFIRVARKH